MKVAVTEHRTLDLVSARITAQTIKTFTSLKDRAIELWSTAAGRLFLVADEDDARRER